MFFRSFIGLCKFFNNLFNIIIKFSNTDRVTIFFTSVLHSSSPHPTEQYNENRNNLFLSIDNLSNYNVSYSTYADYKYFFNRNCLLIIVFRNAYYFITCYMWP